MSKGSRNRVKNFNQFRNNYDKIDWGDHKSDKSKKIVQGVDLSKKLFDREDIVKDGKY